MDRTGWSPGLLQDDSRELSRWLAQRAGAVHLARFVAQEIQEQMDTQAIADVYMTRPQDIACLSIGQWFVSATGINDKELCYAELREAKRLMVSNGYTEIPGVLDALKAYNAKFVEK
jgi:hypothetical protein